MGALFLARRFDGEIQMIAYVTAAASPITATMNTTMPMSPRAASKANLE